MKLNQTAVTHAKQLIKDGKYVVHSEWSEAQPSADAENKLLENNDWSDYSAWHLGVDAKEDKDTKGHYGFPFGDFKKVHRSGVIAAKQRAAQNGYDEIEKAADGLLEMINEREGITT
ncbi:MAG: hypothetical protein ABI690_18465 [Chloroflexota bacterium]